MPGERVADLLQNAIRVAVGDAIADKQSTLDEVSREAANNIGTAQIEAMSLGSGGLLGAVEGLLGDIPVIGRLLDPIKLILGPAGGMVEGVTLGWALGTAIYPALRAFLLPLIHGVNDFTQNEIHDPQDAAEMVSRGLMEHGHGADEAAGGGYDGDHFNRMVALADTHPDVSTLMELFRRRVIDQEFVFTTLQRLGYRDQAANALIALERNLLSPADLALAFLRGEIDESTLQEYAREVGITPADMNVLIGNTGEPPGLMQLLEAYRRGFIDTATLERGIRQSRVRDEWISTVEKLRYEPMSTSDAVRAVVENYMSDQEGAVIAQQNGLEPKHWRFLVESWGRPLAHQEMGSLVHRGLASRKQFDQAMRESDIKDKYIEQSFQTTTRLLPERLIVSAIHYNAITLQEGSKKLLQLGYDRESVSILLKLGLHEAQVRPHELTQGQITTLYEQGTLHGNEARQHLEAIGYSKQNADYLISLADMRAHIAQVRAEQNATRVSYLAGGIDRNEAIRELHAAGISDAQAQHLISLWDREKRRAARTLTEAQIVKAAKAGTFKYDEAVTLLEATGYSRANATVLLNSNGVIPK